MSLSKKIKKEEPISCIIEPTNHLGGLYLGNMEAASDATFLIQNDILAVLTVCPQSIPSSTKGKLSFYHQCMADDEDSYQISKHFDESYRFIESARRSTSVLVHCQMGISRSATLVIAYLIKKNLIGAREALQYVEERRSIVFPNNGFLKQLGIFERQIFNELINETSSARRQTSPRQPQRDYKDYRDFQDYKEYRDYRQQKFDNEFELKMLKLKESNRDYVAKMTYQPYGNKQQTQYQSKRQENTLFSNLYYKHY